MADKYVPDSKLIFIGKPVAQPAILVFGETDAIVIPDNALNLSGQFDDFRFNASIVTLAELALNGRFDDFQFNATGQYLSDCDRPVTGRVDSSYARANSLTTNQTEKTQVMRRAQTGSAGVWSNGKAQASAARSLYRSLLATRAGHIGAWMNAASIRSSQQSGFRELSRNRSCIDTRHQEASPIRSRMQADFADRQRLSRRQGITWQSALRLMYQKSAWLSDAQAYQPAFRSNYQTARAVPVGKSVDVPVRPPIVYVPDAHLLFIEPVSDSTDLVFGIIYVVPGSTIVVPVRRAYIVLNQVEVRRVDGNYLLPVISLSMNIDMDSWTWSFSASLPSSALSYLQPGGNDPVILDANINGKSYLLIAEQIQRNRQFGKSSILVSGRGKSAVLSDPYSPTQSFNNAIDRTAQQLMNDALTFNGVSLGWTIDWKISDWLVPAGSWNHQGNYMSAVTTIANSVGAFVQPDASQKILRIRQRYPFKPWDTSATRADVELPSAVIVTESVAWEDKPAYNSVYVSGTTDRGLLANVVRTGSGGNFSAQMVTDTLITDVVAARARGTAILADTGRIANYSLSLPVLAETGIIEPGTIVKYVDNDAVLGVVKGVAVTANSPSLKQTIEVQVHG